MTKHSKKLKAKTCAERGRNEEIQREEAKGRAAGGERARGTA